MQSRKGINRRIELKPTFTTNNTKRKKEEKKKKMKKN